MQWLSRLRRDAQRGWTAEAGPLDEGPLLSSAFLQQIERLRLQVDRRGTNGLAGDHASERKAHSIEFADYRDYRPGDDFRLIDWNVYARLGQLTLRLTEATEAATLHLLIDCSGSMAFGQPSKFRVAQRLAAALGCLALARYDRVVLGFLQGGEARMLPPLRGKNESGRLLAVLQGMVPQGPLDLQAAVYAFCNRPCRGVGLLISDLLTPDGTAEAVSALRRAGLQPAVIQILAPEETRPRLEGPLELVDCETGATITTAITGAALRAYGDRFAAWTANLETLCAAQQATFLRLATDQPLEQMLIAILRGRLVR
jgi:uncharacterized protein (DUF58 family)